MQYVIGIDPDVQHGLAYAVMACQTRKVRAVYTIPRQLRNGSICGQYDQRLDKLMQYARRWGAVLWVEDIFLAPGKAQNVRAFKGMAAVQGEIVSAARRHGVEVRLVLASTWYSKVLGFTRDRAKLKAASTEKALGFWTGCMSEHEADAVCIAAYGAAQEQRRMAG